MASCIILLDILSLVPLLMISLFSLELWCFYSGKWSHRSTPPKLTPLFINQSELFTVAEVSSTGSHLQWWRTATNKAFIHIFMSQSQMLNASHKQNILLKKSSPRFNLWHMVQLWRHTKHGTSSSTFTCFTWWRRLCFDVQCHCATEAEKRSQNQDCCPTKQVKTPHTTTTNVFTAILNTQSS